MALRRRSPSPTDAASTVDFKEVLAHLASGVAIISCWDGRTPRGLLVSSIIGLSVEPPRFLFCVRKEAGCHDALQIGARMRSSPARRDGLGRGLALRQLLPVERYAPERWSLSRRCPARPTAAAWPTPRCRIDSVADADSHSIFIVSRRTCPQSRLTAGRLEQGLPFLKPRPRGLGGRRH
jgi:hypothetical protein